MLLLKIRAKRKKNKYKYLSSPVWITLTKLFPLKESRLLGLAQWLKPEIPALWEAEAGRSQGQEIESILVNMVKPRLY